jgi:hypothetical protein
MEGKRKLKKSVQRSQRLEGECRVQGEQVCDERVEGRELNESLTI